MTRPERSVKHYRIDVLVESDRDQEQLKMFIEGVLASHRWHFAVKHLGLEEAIHVDADH